MNLQAAREELETREKEALRCYRPSSQQEGFHRSAAKEIVVRGGKRSGKSTSTVIEFASRILGIPIIGADGNPIPQKFPPSRKNDPGRYWVIGFDIKHIGQTIHRLLFEPGLFRVIRDEQTGKWRTFNPADPKDAARHAESEPAGPVIPERFIVPNSWSWENKAAGVFESVTLTNGAQIFAFPSSARNPKQGDSVDGLWIDEDILNASHIKEWQDRLTDRGGWFLWSAWPHTKNYALVQMIDRAEEVEGDEQPRIQQFQFVMTKNPHISAENKDAALARMGDDEEIASRDRGELNLNKWAMYDFTEGVHVVRAAEKIDEQPRDRRHLISLILGREGRMPLNWTRYLAIDPSHTRTAVIIGAVPPPDCEGVRLGPMVVIEDELILQRMTAAEIAKRIRDRVGHLRFEAFIIDRNAGRQTHAGREDSTMQHFAKEFAAAGLESRITKSSFVPGCNDPPMRYRAVRKYLSEAGDGQAKLFLVEQKTWATQKEFHTYRKKQLDVGGEETILDEPANPRKHDAMACHDAETEVLTHDGWKRFANLAGTESLATVNIERNELQYQRPTALFSKEYSGEMVRLGGMKMDGLVTPNHRMVVYQRPRKADWDVVEPRIVEADNLTPYQCVKLAANWNAPERSSPILVPRVFNQGGLEKEIDPGLLAEFLGWYVSEGCKDTIVKCPGNGYRVNIAQHKLAGLAMLQPLLEQLPWKWTRHKSGFSCSSKQLWHYLENCYQPGAEHHNCYTKIVPEWIKWADKETIRRFMVGAVAGDGNIQFGKRNYYTSSERLSGDIQELFIKLGVTASIHERHPVRGGCIRGRQVTGSCINYRVLEKIRPIAYLGDRANKPNFSRVQYEGMVYCAAVPNQTLITRRNGRVMVSGNSLEYLIAYLDPLFENGTAYHVPQHTVSGGSPAYQRAMSLLGERNAKQPSYVHLGPGAAA